MLTILTPILHQSAQAALGRISTPEQIERLCVQLMLTVDGQEHNFYYKQIRSFDDRGVDIMWGKGLTKINHIEKIDIMNFTEAKDKYERLKAERP